MPSLTPAEAKMLGRRAQQPVKAPGELLAIFVAGKLVNTKNARLHYMAESRYKRGWRERVALALFEHLGQHEYTRHKWYDATTPKRIAFLASTAKAMDDDGLAVSIAPVRDALIQCGVIHSDAPDSGHEFTYAQQIDRAHRGVTIRVSPREPR